MTARIMTARITREHLRGAGACYSDERIAELVPRDGLSPRETAALPIPASDRHWALCYGIGPGRWDRELRLHAVWCVRRALARVAEPDPRSVTACDVAEQYALGQASLDELRSAYADAAAAADASDYAYAYAAAAALRGSGSDAAAYASAAAYNASRPPINAAIADLVARLEGANAWRTRTLSVDRDLMRLCDDHEEAVETLRDALDGLMYLSEYSSDDREVLRRAQRAIAKAEGSVLGESWHLPCKDQR